MGHMHALGRFVQDLMDETGMTQADLMRASGLSKQHVSQLLDDDKTRLGRMVADRTIAGLAKAFPDVGEGSIITKAAEAMGVPVDRLQAVSPNYEALSNEALLGILRDRLKGDSDVGKSAEKSVKLRQVTERPTRLIPAAPQTPTAPGRQSKSPRQD